ncbi:LOW QUALITY PROTEIN: dexamethasone-induced Ras-related protein 1 [Cottoperca gobio]|uniref:LOW QUALITY PROTEIN: dexamethasone-induced Ras-related protein 1 n=1 Tax=Cottoperca gobio TaxID=56716 RepID=A0A6J2Q1P3_COTGO|nr:LOW QUALITY PROTEIN: dexamethasone-induced Ras-related protein 1-like [Cottoperca gobio]
MAYIKTTDISHCAGDKLEQAYETPSQNLSTLLRGTSGSTHNKTMERGSISTGAQTTSIPVAHQLNCSTIEDPKFHDNMDGQCAGTSKALLAYKNASQHLSSSGIKAGLGILKLASSQWKQEKKTRSGTAVRQLSTANSSHPCKISPLDQLAALFLHGQSRQRQIGQEQATTKPQNCKRIVVLGAPRVGKTSILRRYLRDGFVEEYNPTSEDFLRKLFRIRGETYQIDVLDASRERDFPAKRRLSILTGDIFLLVFSLDDRSSFEEVCALRTEILAAKSKLTKSCMPEQCAQPQVPLVVCANKVDLLESERGISKEEVLQALGEDSAYFETSAKESTNLEKVFETLAKRGGLPTETGPSQHRKLSLRSYQAMRTSRVPGRGSSQTPGRNDACGALYPLAHRPSFSTDLRQVIGPHTARKPGKALEKCQIQ